MSTIPSGPWLLVVGCHRSGTSAIAGALGELGLQAVDPADRIDATAGNTEHWESLSLTLFDEDLLAARCATWDAPPEFDNGPADAPTPANGPDPTEPLTTAFPQAGPIVWKDPRVCLLLPYWRSVLPGPVTAVFVWREPLAVARSLHTRDGIPLADGLALWEHYTRSAVIGLQGVDTYVLPYESLVGAPGDALTPVVDWLRGLGRFDPWSEAWDVDRAAASIDVKLRHESGVRDAGATDLPHDHESVAEWLTSVAGPHAPLVASPPPSTTVWSEALLATRREYGRSARESEEARTALEALVQSREALLSAVRQQLAGEKMVSEGAQRELERLRASTSWRVTKPLRTVIGGVQHIAGE